MGAPPLGSILFRSVMATTSDSASDNIGSNPIGISMNIASWCNGNIDDFGSFVQSSNLCGASIKNGRLPKW